MKSTITCALYDLSYKQILSKYSDFIRDNYIEVLKYNKGFDVQHFIIKCVCNESVSLYVYNEHKDSHLHKCIINKNLKSVNSILKQYLNRDIRSIVDIYLY